MKKILLALFSALFYAAAFWLCMFVSFRTGNIGFFSAGFPLAVVLYFGMTNKVFKKRFSLSSVSLWIWMNIVGPALALVGLAAVFPTILFGGAVFFFVAPAYIFLAAVWTIAALAQIFGRHEDPSFRKL